MTRRRWCPWVLGGLVLLMVAYVWLRVVIPSTRFIPIECTVVNDSAQTIERVAVTVFHRTYRAEGLAPGGSFSFMFDTAGDDHYHVEAQLASGEQRVADVGYLTTGAVQADRIEIGADEVRIDSALQDLAY